jgi:hypothetical protein
LARPVAAFSSWTSTEPLFWLQSFSATGFKRPKPSILLQSPLLADTFQFDCDIGRRQELINASGLGGALRHVRLAGRLEFLSEHKTTRFLYRLKCRRPVGIES